jgi:ribosomal protein L11 methyltransferase
MSFVALRFDVGAAQAEGWADALLEAGALAVDLSDPGAGTPAESPLYGEPDVFDAGLWPIARVDATFAAGCDVDAVLRAATQAVGRPLPAYEQRPVAERDWVRDSQSQFAPIEVGEGFWIVPTWCEPPDPSAINLALDPGLAFGTGSHPTTRLCLAWLYERGVRGDDVLDYGCGSGILAIAAMKLGAARACGVDVDPQAIRAATDNARANRVDARFCLPHALRAGTHDVVVANILANPLILLAPALSARVRGGGCIALAGILDTQADNVAEAYAQWFTLAPWRRVDGWVMLAGVRRT